MFAICHTLDNKEDIFIMYDKKDMKEISEQMGIEIEQSITLAQLIKDYSFYPILSCDDLILRVLNRKTRTDTRVLDEIGLRSFISIKKENELIKEKASRLSRSQRETVARVYNEIMNMDQPEIAIEEADKTD